MANYTDMSDEQLVHRVLQVERDLIGARFKHRLNQLENTARLRVLRREIARLRTEARARELQQGLPKDALLVKHRSTFQGAGAPASEARAPGEKGSFLSGIVDKLTGKE